MGGAIGIRLSHASFLISPGWSELRGGHSFPYRSAYTLRQGLFNVCHGDEALRYLILGQEAAAAVVLLPTRF